MTLSSQKAACFHYKVIIPKLEWALTLGGQLTMLPQQCAFPGPLQVLWLPTLCGGPQHTRIHSAGPLISEAGFFKQIVQQELPSSLPSLWRAVLLPLLTLSSPALGPIASCFLRGLGVNCPSSHSCLQHPLFKCFLLPVCKPIPLSHSRKKASHPTTSYLAWSSPLERAKLLKSFETCLHFLTSFSFTFSSTASV